MSALTESINHNENLTRLVSLITRQLADDNLLIDTDAARDAAIASIRSVCARADELLPAPVQKSVSPKSRKKSKSTKPRKRTAYNMFVKNEIASARVELGDAAKVRGAVMKELGRRWKLLDEDAKKPYAALADTANAELATISATEPTTPAIIPPTDYDDLVGVYSGTYAFGVVTGTKSFKTLDEAVIAMRENQNAVAIVQSKSGKRFRLRAGHTDPRNKPNKDSDGNTTPVFVYNGGTTENTWVRKSALAHHDAYGPFTKTNPFCADKSLAPTTPTESETV